MVFMSSGGGKAVNFGILKNVVASSVNSVRKFVKRDTVNVVEGLIVGEIVCTSTPTNDLVVVKKNE